MKRLLIFLLLQTVGLLASGRASGVALSQAMSAPVILEVFVEPESLRVELEIGQSAWLAFADLLPDAVYVEVTGRSVPLSERLPAFFRSGLVLRAEGQPPWGGRVEELVQRTRVPRDEMTGDWRPAAADSTNLPPVVVARLRYEMTTRPAAVSLEPPWNPETERAAAEVGFVLYHLGLPVNDFRLLAREETVDLDWADPWFSRFRNPDLGRQVASPLQVFLYVDPYEVRREILVRPLDLQRWVDLGLEGRTTIPAAAQDSLKKQVADFLAVMNPVTLDGQSPAPNLDRIDFIERTLRQTRVIDPPLDLPVSSAVLGVVHAYPVAGWPQHVFLEWELFHERLNEVPALVADEAGSSVSRLDPDHAVLEWRNPGHESDRPALTPWPSPPPPPPILVPWLSLVCLGILGFGVGGMLVRRRRPPGVVLLAGVGLVGLAGVLWPVGRWPVPQPWRSTVPLSSDEAGHLILGLLRNIYAAFDYREEEQIYDLLERSVAGDLLTQIYLETLGSLKLENQGGARTKVKDVALVSAEVRPLSSGAGFQARCVWNVTGRVGHWGHVHERRNQHQARLTVQVMDGYWRLTELEMLEERRL